MNKDTISKAIAQGERIRLRALKKAATENKRKEEHARKVFQAELRLARRWVKKFLAGKIKYAASIGQHSISLNNEGIKGTKVAFISAEAKYHAVAELKDPNIRARSETREEKECDECALTNVTHYWVEWGKQEPQYGYWNR